MFPPRQAPRDKHHHKGSVYSAPITFLISRSIGVIVLFFFFIPILYVYTFNDFYANGYRILVGSYLQVPSDIDPEVMETVTLLRTSSFNFCAILFPIGTFLFYRIVSSAPAKRFSAFLCGVVGFLYILLIVLLHF